MLRQIWRRSVWQPRLWVERRGAYRIRGGTCGGLEAGMIRGSGTRGRAGADRVGGYEAEAGHAGRHVTCR
jgi:hypothetical protein